jgi:hypothetical protein
MARFKGNNECWWGCSKTGTLIYCWWGCKLVQPLWKAVWRFLKKLKIELPYDPVILLQGIYPKEHKSKYNRHTDVHHSTTQNSQDMETTPFSSLSSHCSPISELIFQFNYLNMVSCSHLAFTHDLLQFLKWFPQPVISLPFLNVYLYHDSIQCYSIYDGPLSW